MLKVTAFSFASILMIFACQCFLFEEQFNKQSLAFHVEGKICNGIHLPGSSSSVCDWIKPFAVNGEVLVARRTPWVHPAQGEDGQGRREGDEFRNDSRLCFNLPYFKTIFQRTQT